jgi:hypothetical protein
MLESPVTTAMTASPKSGCGTPRIDVETTRDDDILGATEKSDAACGIHRADISGNEESIGAEILRPRALAPPIAGKYIWSPDLEHADFSRRQEPPVAICDPHFDARQGKTDRTRHALAGNRIGRNHAGFRHAIAFENLPAGAGRYGGMGLGKKGCRS